MARPTSSRPRIQGLRITRRRAAPISARSRQELASHFANAAGGPQLRARFTLEVGRLVKGQARSQLESACFRAGLACTIRDTGGWLSSTLLIQVEGEESTVRGFLESVQRWVRENG